MVRRASNAGFTLVGAMVAVAVVNILLAVAITSWLKLDRRAREAELIWRGQQIARALGCYQRESSGSLPETLDELVESGCLRRLYEDPMVPDGRWRILTEQDLLDGTIEQLSGEPLAGTGAAPPGEDVAGPRAPSDGANRTRAPAVAGSAASGLRFQFQLRGMGGESASRQGIVGVSSRAEDEASRSFHDRTRYAEWLFLVQEDGRPGRP